jgi:large subunit ribosomal protein L18
MTTQKSKIIKKDRIRKNLNPNQHLRLTVYKSNKHIYGQIIDDIKKITLLSVSDMDEEIKKQKDLKKSEVAQKVGELLAQKALEKKIKQVVFDRGYFRYHGRIKALAEGARTAGLKI